MKTHLSKTEQNTEHRTQLLYSTPSISTKMDPCPFVRIIVSDLALKFPVSSKPSFSVVHPCTSCFCKIKFSNFPTQFATIPLLIPQRDNPNPHSNSHFVAACFYLNKTQVENLSKKKPLLKISVYTGRMGTATCGLQQSSSLVGNISVPLDLGSAESKLCVFQNGWVSVGEKNKGSLAQLHLNFLSEPDPRFVFQFDGEPECSPQVFQVQGSIKQPVFTCKFGLRSSSDLKARTMSKQSSAKRNWLHSLKPQKDQNTKERKGWSITIHDLSGSPVALASMVTPFVASPGSDSVSRSNPGAWLILRPGEGTWKPWGRLEAWRVRGSGSDSIGFRFELDSDTATAAATLANSTVSASNGGKFTIDVASGGASPLHGLSPQSSSDFGSSSSESRPGSRPGSGSGSDFGFGLGSSQVSYKGFVMSSEVKGMKNGSVKPEVEVGVQHVTCSEDAAAFVALAAAVNLSVDACRLFSQRLRKELRQ